MKRDYTEAELSMRLRHALSRESARTLKGHIGGAEIADRNNVNIVLDVEGVGNDPKNYKELTINNMIHELGLLGVTVKSNYSMGSQLHHIVVDTLSLIDSLRRSESIGEAIEKEVRERDSKTSPIC
jgi:hypothetical protein